jgi:hypothetical protein
MAVQLQRTMVSISSAMLVFGFGCATTSAQVQREAAAYCSDVLKIGFMEHYSSDVHFSSLKQGLEWLCDKEKQHEDSQGDVSATGYGSGSFKASKGYYKEHCLENQRSDWSDSSSKAVRDTLSPILGDAIRAWSQCLGARAEPSGATVRLDLENIPQPGIESVYVLSMEHPRVSVRQPQLTWQEDVKFVVDTDDRDSRNAMNCNPALPAKDAIVDRGEWRCTRANHVGRGRNIALRAVTEYGPISPRVVIPAATPRCSDFCLDCRYGLGGDAAYCYHQRWQLKDGTATRTNSVTGVYRQLGFGVTCAQLPPRSRVSVTFRGTFTPVNPGDWDPAMGLIEVRRDLLDDMTATIARQPLAFRSEGRLQNGALANVELYRNDGEPDERGTLDVAVYGFSQVNGYVGLNIVPPAILECRVQ